MTAAIANNLQAVFPVHVSRGDLIHDYRGRVWAFRGAVAPSVEGRVMGRVMVESIATEELREFYDVVFPGLVVREAVIVETRGDDRVDTE